MSLLFPFVKQQFYSISNTSALCMMYYLRIANKDIDVSM